MTPGARATTPVVLSLAHIAKRFGRVEALADASLTLRAGTVHALLGENGAGKTTLLRIAYGLLPPDAGDVRIDGAPVTLRSPATAIARGIGMVSQHFTLVPAMTVAENVALGGHGRYAARAVGAALERVARETGLTLDPAARVDTLSVSAQQRLEIVKALTRHARILILDEPTAILAPTEAADLLRWLRAFADAGHAVVLITHKLREALAVADDITVLRRGRSVLHAPAPTLDEGALVDAMLGGEPPPRAETERLPSAIPPTGATVARARTLRLVDERGVTRIHGATFDVRAGEILGVAGVEHSGHRELLRALAGRLTPTAGALDLPPHIGFVPEDRHRDALILPMTLRENVALGGAGARRGWTRWGARTRETDRLIAQFGIVAAGPAVAVETLSGGNQQKLVLARELAGAPALLVAENPTRGLDVRAAAFVFEHLRAARARGAAVVLYSSDVDDVLALADRMLVVYAGSVHEAPAERERVGRLMLGATG